MPLIDDFNRANSTGLGPNWARNPFGLTLGGPLLPDVTSNQATYTGANFGLAYYTPASSGSNDCHVGCQIVTGSGAYPVSLYLLTSGVGTTSAVGYQFALAAMSGANNCELYSEDGAGAEPLLTTATQAFSNGDWIWLATVGTAVRMYRGTTSEFSAATQITSFTDNDHRSTSTIIAVQMQQNMVIDNVYGTPQARPYSNTSIG